jgi:hypothetical protein
MAFDVTGDPAFPERAGFEVAREHFEAQAKADTVTHLQSRSEEVVELTTLSANWVKRFGKVVAAEMRL